jgi:glycosyltransferase involved in cell wall biosynthesis
MKEFLETDNGAAGERRRLRINFILPGANLSGGIKSSRLIAEAMVRRGHEVRVIFPVKPVPLASVLHPRQWAKGVWRRLKALTQRNQHHLLRSSADLIAVEHHRVEAEHVPDADVTIGSWWETMESVSNWPSSKGIKVHYIRGYEVFCRLRRARVENIYRLDCMKIVIGNWLKRIMEKEYQKTAVVIPNGIDRTQFNVGKRSRAAVPTVGFLYSTSPVKGLDTAFEAIRIIQRQMPELQVISYGAMSVRGHVPPRNFNFILQPAQAEISRIYSAVDCWVVSSLSEGLGMPGLEAAACRCPIVATRCGGSQDYVQDGRNGYLVPIQDPQAMAQRILDVLNASDQEWRRMSEESHTISKGFDWDHSAVLLEDALLDAIGRQGAHAASEQCTSEVGSSNPKAGLACPS